MKKAGGTKDHPVVSREEWLAARTAFLGKEKEFTRRRDELSAARRALPWVKVEKPYVFDGPDGKESLSDLFEKRSQLVVYHFMFTPSWDEGCKHCSFWADGFDPMIVHLNHRDTTMVAISRAPLAKLKKFQKRMGWGFKWLSSGEGDFNFDFGVSFHPEEIKAGTAFYNYQRGKQLPDREGTSCFIKRGKDVFHTYSTFARGIDLMNTAYNILDLTAIGRDEADGPQTWVRYHDRY